MTDNEVIKALECCSNNVLYEQCVDCPHEEYLEKGHTCIIRATKDALDLINKQKAENTELQRKNAELKIELKAIKAEIERLECSIISQDEEKLSYVAMLIKEEQERIRLEQIRRLEAEIERLQKVINTDIVFVGRRR